MGIPTVLEKIVERKKEEVTQRKSKVSAEVLKKQIEGVPSTRGFVSAIEAKLANQQAAVIAEIKKASPSKGVLCEHFVPSEIAQSYEQGGAVCLSVLTDIDFFQGCDAYLQEAKAACNLPVLRKDFIIDEYQIIEARAIGADCILLIVACLTDEELTQFSQLAVSLGLDVLVEVHDKAELARALVLNTKLIGINNRNLHNFNVSLNATLGLLSSIPADRIIVTESGIHTKNDVMLMRANNVNTFLVGEAFMKADSPGEKLSELFA